METSGENLRCGEGGIRTPDAGITDVTVFETAAFNHSATSPRESVPPPPTPFNCHDTTPLANGSQRTRAISRRTSFRELLLRQYQLKLKV